MGRGTTKIDEHILERVRRYARKNFLTVSGFINATLKRELDAIEGSSAYRSAMSEFLIKKPNKKKK